VKNRWCTTGSIGILGGREAVEMANQFGRRMSMDSRMVDEISRSPKMMADQGSGWLDSWGGTSGYQYWAKQPVSDRMTYFAVIEGYDTAKDIADVTGLRGVDVVRSLAKLGDAGLVDIGVVEK